MSDEFGEITEDTPTDAEIDEAYGRIWLIDRLPYSWKTKFLLGSFIEEGRLSRRDGIPLDEIRKTLEASRSRSDLSEVHPDDRERYRAEMSKFYEVALEYIGRTPDAGR